MQSVMIGTIRGRVIEFGHETGFVDGQRLTVTLAVDAPLSRRDASSVIEECAGAWADAEDDEFARWENETARLRRCEHRDQNAHSANNGTRAPLQ